VSAVAAVLSVAVGAAVVGGPGTANAGPADLTGDEVCALASGADVGEALDVTVSSTSASELGTPQCSYQYTDSQGARSNVVVAVQRVDRDLGGRTGRRAFAYAVKANKVYAGKGSKFTKVSGVGTRATFADGKATKNLIVGTDDGGVLTVAGSGLDRASALAIAEVVIAGMNASAPG
jgi:hypothetical protein